MRPSSLLPAALFTSVACTSDDLLDSSEPDPWAHRAEELLLAADDGELSERTRLHWLGEARWSADGEPWGEQDVALVARTLEVADPGARVGVIVAAGAVDLLVYLDREDLEPTVWGWTRGAGGPVAPEDAGVWLPPGLPVEQLDEEEGGVWLGWEGADLAGVEVWVPGDAMDVVYEPDPDGVRSIEADADLVVLGAGVPLLDGPGGEVLAHTRGPDEGASEGRRVWAERRGETWQAHVPVRLVDHAPERPSATVELVGWVHEEDIAGGLTGLRGRGLSTFGFGSCGWGIGGVGSYPEGTLVREGSGGEVVGRLTRAWSLLSADQLHEPLELLTPWGDVRLELDPGDFAWAEELAAEP